MISSDALSRNEQYLEVNNILRVERGENLNKKILKIHEKHKHKGNLKEELKKEELNISATKVRKILNYCLKYQEYNNKNVVAKRFIETTKPGELIGMDVLEVEGKRKILLAIDYFTRKIIRRMISTKKPIEVIKLLEEMKGTLSIKKILMDSGREFKNNEIRKWLKDNQIDCVYATPYYHQGNERIERANRTIGEAISKTKGPLKTKLKSVLDSYTVRKKTFRMFQSIP